MRSSELAKKSFNDIVELSGAVLALQEIGERLHVLSWTEEQWIRGWLRNIKESMQIREEKKATAPPNGSGDSRQLL